MALEQQMERSEELLETNEQNKERVEQARDQVRRADNRVSAAQAQTQYAYNQLQQAIAARNAAQQRASQEENGSVPASYDAAVSSAEAELRSAQRELEESRRERIEADRELHNAEGALAESTRELHNVAAELQQVSEKYGVNLSRTSQLMNLPYSQLASPLLQQLGIGKDRVDDLRMRIAASLGITAAATGGGYGGGGGGYSGGGRRAGGVSGSYGSYTGSSTGGAYTGGYRPQNKTSDGATQRSSATSGTTSRQTRSLNETEKQNLQRNTGWTEGQIKKCTTDDNGVIHYRTDNCNKEGTTSKTGVPYVRKQVQLFGYTVEGVFPVFNSAMDVQLPTSLEKETNRKQFNYCNETLKSQIEKDPELRAIFTEEQLDDIENGETPEGYVWHHNEEQGKMQLTRIEDHDRTQGGAAHTGGKALWGGGYTEPSGVLSMEELLGEDVEDFGILPDQEGK